MLDRELHPSENSGDHTIALEVGDLREGYESVGSREVNATIPSGRRAWVRDGVGTLLAEERIGCSEHRNSSMRFGGSPARSVHTLVSPSLPTQALNESERRKGGDQGHRRSSRIRCRRAALGDQQRNGSKANAALKLQPVQP